MTKMNSIKSPSLQEEPAREQGKPSLAPKKHVSEIDEIFAGKKRKKPEPKKTEKSEEDLTKRPEKKRKKKNKKTKGPSDGQFGDQPSLPRKRTEDGLAIYTEEELGVNKADAGNTPLCPFDCSCCF